MRTVIGAILLLASNPVFAQNKPIAATISQGDNQKIDALVDPIFKKLSSGDTRGAVNGFLGESPLFGGRTTELENLTAQIDTSIRLYGPISNCEFSEFEDRSGLVQQRLYLCQHQNFLTRWHVTVGKATGGWIPVALSFNDQITSGF